MENPKDLISSNPSNFTQAPRLHNLSFGHTRLESPHLLHTVVQKNEGRSHLAPNFKTVLEILPKNFNDLMTLLFQYPLLICPAAIKLMWTCSFGAPNRYILERISVVLIYPSRENEQVSWLVATCESSSSDWDRTRDLPRPNAAP